MASPTDPYQRAHTSLVTASRGCLEKEDEYGDELVDIPNIVVFVDLAASTPLIHCLSWYDLRAVLIAPGTAPNDRVRFWQSDPIPSNYVYHVHDRWYDPALEPLTRYYNTFLYTGSYDAPIGTYFAMSALHGATERLHRVRPVHRADVLAYVREEITADELRERLWATVGRAAADPAATLVPTTFRPQPLDTILPEATLTARQAVIGRVADGQPFGPSDWWRRGAPDTYTIFSGDALPPDSAPAEAASMAPPGGRPPAWIDPQLLTGSQAPVNGNWMQSLLRRVLGDRAPVQGAAAVGDAVIEREVVPPSPPRPVRLFQRDAGDAADDDMSLDFPPLPPLPPSRLAYRVQLPAGRDVYQVGLEEDGRVVDIERDDVRWQGSLFLEALVIEQVPVSVQVEMVDGRPLVQVHTLPSPDNTLPVTAIVRWQRYFQRELESRPAVALVRMAGVHVFSLWEVEVWRYGNDFQFLVDGHHVPMPSLYRGVLDLTTPDGNEHYRLLAPTDTPASAPAVFRYDDETCGYRAGDLPAGMAGHVAALLAAHAHYYEERLVLPYLLHGDVRYIWAADTLYSLQDGNEYIPPVRTGTTHVILHGRQWEYDSVTGHLLDHNGTVIEQSPAPVHPLLVLLAAPVLATIDYGGPALTIRKADDRLYYTETPRQPIAAARGLWAPVLLTRTFYVGAPRQQRTAVTLPTVLPERWAVLEEALPAEVPGPLRDLLQRQFVAYHAATTDAVYSNFNLEDIDAGGDMISVHYTADELVFWDVVDESLVTPPDLARPSIRLVYEYDTEVRVFRDAYGRNIPVVEGGWDAVAPAVRADFERLWPTLDSAMVAYHPHPCGSLSPGALIYGNLHIYPWNGNYVAVDQRTGELVTPPLLPADANGVTGRPTDVAAYRRFSER